VGIILWAWGRELFFWFFVGGKAEIVFCGREGQGALFFVFGCVFGSAREVARGGCSSGRARGRWSIQNRGLALLGRAFLFFCFFVFLFFCFFVFCFFNPNIDTVINPHHSKYREISTLSISPIQPHSSDSTHPKANKSKQEQTRASKQEQANKSKQEQTRATMDNTTASGSSGSLGFGSKKQPSENRRISPNDKKKKIICPAKRASEWWDVSGPVPAPAPPSLSDALKVVSDAIGCYVKAFEAAEDKALQAADAIEESEPNPDFKRMEKVAADLNGQIPKGVQNNAQQVVDAFIPLFKLAGEHTDAIIGNCVEGDWTCIGAKETAECGLNTPNYVAANILELGAGLFAN
jgi:hypothetical protein